MTDNKNQPNRGQERDQRKGGARRQGPAPKAPRGDAGRGKRGDVEEGGYKTPRTPNYGDTEPNDPRRTDVEAGQTEEGGAGRAGQTG